MENLLMALTVALSAGRNLLSKEIGRRQDGRRDFFLAQTMLFSGGMALLFFLDPGRVCAFSPGVLPYALIYGVFLILSQWLYTCALKTGGVSVCSLVYSFGFIIPTVSGALVWNEQFGAMKYIGVACAVITLLFSAKAESGSGKSGKTFLPLIAAMLSSGGLGVMQKIQQKSAFGDETNAFLFFAFLFAFAVSLAALLLTKKEAAKGRAPGLVIVSGSAGLCFGGANYINTILAGMLESSVFFPVQNIATVVVSALLGMLLFGEKPTFRKVCSFAFGIAAILILKL